MFEAKVKCRDCGDTVAKREAYVAGKDAYQCKGCYLAEPFMEIIRIGTVLRRRREVRE